MGQCVELLIVLGCSMNILKKSFQPKGEAAKILFDTVPSINYITGKEIVGLKPNLWNKDEVGAWCKYLGKTDYDTK